MQMRCWASLLALLPALALAGGEPDTGVRAEAAGPGKTKLVFNGGRGPVLVVARDGAVPAQARPAAVVVVASLGDQVLVLADSYPSRLNQGQGPCGAGEERFLRVVRLTPAPVRQTWQLKLASCTQEIELQGEFAQGGIAWSPETSELRIQWLSGPTQQAPESRRLHIDRDGRVKDLKPA